MPAIYAHLRFGDEVAATLPSDLRECADKYPEAFHLGTQGPDILFYHKPLTKNDIRAYGTTLHRMSAEEFFLPAATTLLSEGNADSPKKAYLMGFLCHFTLDVTCHPFIDEHSSTQLTHGKIESEFDKYLLRKDGKPIRGYNTATPISGENFTAEACASLLDVPLKNIHRAVKTMKKINGWFSKKCELFHVFAHTFLKIAGLERKFGDMFLHKKDDPLCENLNGRLFEKFQTAISHASELIQEYFSSLQTAVVEKKLQNEIFRSNYSGIYLTEV